MNLAGAVQTISTKNLTRPQLILSGADINTVRELLGHADLKTTLIYIHLSQDRKKRAVEVLNQRISSSEGKQELKDLQEFY